MRDQSIHGKLEEGRVFIESDAAGCGLNHLRVRVMLKFKMPLGRLFEMGE